MRDYAEKAPERAAMVRTQIAEPVDGRPPIRDPRVLEAMQRVPRHRFVPENMRRLAHADRPLPIGRGQTISQPYIVAWMVELLELGSGARVLEVGLGSGYQAAVLSCVAAEVYAVDIVEELVEKSRALLEELGCQNVHTRAGDGHQGWPEAAPFDGIVVACAAEEVPPPLVEQLAPGASLVVPVGAHRAVQELRRIRRDADGELEDEVVTHVGFVPLVRGEVR